MDVCVLCARVLHACSVGFMCGVRGGVRHAVAMVMWIEISGILCCDEEMCVLGLNDGVEDLGLRGG